MLGGCLPYDSQSFGKFRLVGDEMEERGEQPETVHIFAKTARRHSRLYSSAYGVDHLGERLKALARLNEIHEERPEFCTHNFLAGEWERMVFQYAACVAEGVQFTLCRYDVGITIGEIRKKCFGSGSFSWGGLEARAHFGLRQ